MQKNLYFYHFSWKKEVKLGKNQKKAVAGINCGPWPIFPNITHLTFDPHIFFLLFLGFGVSHEIDSGHIFFLLFLGENRSNNKIFGPMTHFWKKTYGHQLKNQKKAVPWPIFWQPQKNRSNWPTFIYRGDVPADTFAKLPVCTLITDLKKFDPKKVISVKTTHLAMWATSLSRTKYFGTSPKLPVHALIHDP